ncbi:signal transduction histidine kinase [Hyaloraphidium curvatum]|nr:signal transduction histidine kinase [Hyaloraphidium curvatum]
MGGSSGGGDADEIIDKTIFEQLLEMDEDDEDREFSRSIVVNYFEQATQTFDKMVAALDEKDLPQLSKLGHFLKGSSAALGLQKVKSSCEKIQHYGNLRSEDGKDEISEADAVDLIKKLLDQAKGEYEEAEVWLKDFYHLDEDGDS